MFNTKTVDLVQYTNHIGQIINPGDEVVYVTTGYSGSVYTHHGFYLGINNGVFKTPKVGKFINEEIKNPAFTGWNCGHPYWIKTGNRVLSTTTLKRSRVYKIEPVNKNVAELDKLKAMIADLINA